MLLAAGRGHLEGLADSSRRDRCAGLRLGRDCPGAGRLAPDPQAATRARAGSLRLVTQSTYLRRARQNELTPR